MISAQTDKAVKVERLDCEVVPVFGHPRVALRYRSVTLSDSYRYDYKGHIGI